MQQQDEYSQNSSCQAQRRVEGRAGLALGIPDYPIEHLR